MSEQIDNREYRKQVIKDIISDLHQGKSVDEVKQRFEKAFDGVSATEISQAEQALISEGLPVSEVQRLCDVHASVFKGSIEDIHRTVDDSEIPGHPAYIIKQENRVIEDVIENKIKPHLTNIQDKTSSFMLISALNELSDIDVHYLRKENLFFPYLEKYGISGPPKVMWGVDDEIRDQLEETIEHLSNSPDNPSTKEKIETLIDRISEMIFKEENILLPMMLDTLTMDEWKKIADESYELGFLLEDVPEWEPTVKEDKHIESEKGWANFITLPTGVLKNTELISMLNTLPFDITFVDKDDSVKYFSEGPERIFPRTKSVIGRNVSNCHPPASVHIVEKIVSDFKKGVKDHEDFWIKAGDKYVYIRYFAVRDEAGDYIGTLEVTQNIKPIQEIDGEKRLVSE